MLNESLEFISYVSDPRSINPRLQPKILTKRFSDNLLYVNQVMSVVARGFLFSEYGKELFEDGLITDNGILATKELLNRWCGFEVEEKKPETELVDKWFMKYDQAEQWLKKYWIFHFCEHKKKSDKDFEGDEEEISEIWDSYAKEWQEKYNSAKAYTAEAITFDNIIADAIQKGELRELYCGILKSDSTKCIRDINDLYSYIYRYNGKPNSNTKLRMLRNIISFRIWQSEHPGMQKEVFRQTLRLFGWYGKDFDDARKRNWCFTEFIWNGVNVIYSIGYIDFAKFGIDQRYIDQFEFKLICPDEVDDYKDKYWILKDCGHGDNHPLEIINHL